MGTFGKSNIEKMERERDVDGLIKALGDKDEDVRLAAAEALGEMGDEGTPLSEIKAYGMLPFDKRAVEPLIKALGDKSWMVRDAAAEALGRIGGKRAVEPLIKALGDKNGIVRREVELFLGLIGDKRAVEPLIKVLRDKKDERAAEALGRIGDKRAVKPLIKALRHPHVCGAAAEALGEIGDPRAVKPLVEVFLKAVGIVDIADRMGADYPLEIDGVLNRAGTALGKFGIDPWDLYGKSKGKRRSKS